MISILCPSRGRPDFARELQETIRATAYSDDYELILRLDDDDPTLTQYYDRVDGSDVQFLVGPRVVLSQCWNDAADKATRDVLMLCGDDIRFRTIDWDKRVCEVIDEYRDKIVLVHGSDGIQGDRVATHPFMHRRWMETVGYFVPPLFASDYNDLWLTEVADAIGRRRYLPEIYTEHMHPAVGKWHIDQTHQERLARHQAQNCDQLYRDTESDRAQDVAKLWAIINSPQEPAMSENETEPNLTPTEDPQGVTEPSTAPEETSPDETVVVEKPEDDPDYVEPTHDDGGAAGPLSTEGNTQEF